MIDNKLILIVDDDRELAEKYGELFREQRFVPRIEHNGAKALRIFQDENIDVCMIDALLPELDGFKLVEEIRNFGNKGKSVPIMMISGVLKSSQHGTDATQKHDLIGYLDKPATMDKVLSVFYKAMGEDFPGSWRPAEEIAARNRSTNIDFFKEKSIDGKFSTLKETLNKKSKKQDLYERRPRKNVPPPQEILHAARNPYYLLQSFKAPSDGNLAEVPLPVIMQHVLASNFTGGLFLTRQNVKKAAYFNQGKPIAVLSNVASDQFGHWLVRKKIIGADQLQEALSQSKVKNQRSTEISQIEALVGIGALEQANALELIPRYFQWKFKKLFTWVEGSYQFQPVSKLPLVQAELDRHPLMLLRSAIEERIPKAEVKKWLKPYMHSPIGLNSENEYILPHMGLKLKEANFVRKLDFTRTVCEVIRDESAGIPTKKMAKFLFLLICQDAVMLYPPLVPLKDNTVEFLESDSDLVDTEPPGSITEPPGSVLENSSSSTKIPMIRKKLTPEQRREKEFQSHLAEIPPKYHKQFKELFKYREKLLDENHFGRLEVSQTTAQSEIKKNYSLMAKKFHPDAMPGKEIEQVRKLGADIFNLITEAFNAISTEQKRNKYIEDLRTGANVDASDEVSKILNAENHFHGGMAALMKKNYPKAKEEFNEAIKLNPNEGEYYAQLGWVHFNLNSKDSKQTREAIQYLAKAAKMTPKLDVTHFYIATIFKLTGDLDKAVKAFRKCLALNPKNIRAKSELHLLETRKKRQAKEPEEKKSSLFGFLKKKE